jgi:hypothetical protein
VNVFSCMVVLLDEKNMYTVSVLNLPDFWLQYSANSSENTGLSRNRKGDRSRCTCSVTLCYLNFNNWPLVLECLSRLSKKQATCRKNPCNNIPQTNEHLHTAAHLSKAREFKPYMEKRRVRPLSM